MTNLLEGVVKARDRIQDQGIEQAGGRQDRYNKQSS